MNPDDRRSFRDYVTAGAMLFGWSCFVAAILMFCFTMINVGDLS